MISSVCENTLKTCVKSDPQFIKHRCEIDAKKQNEKRSENGTNMIPKRVPKSIQNLKKVEKRDAEIEIENRCTQNAVDQQQKRVKNRHGWTPGSILGGGGE